MPSVRWQPACHTCKPPANQARPRLLRMPEFVTNLGVFVWPLGLCSALALFIIVERLFALRQSRVLPLAIRDQFVRGAIPAAGDESSVVGRILLFYYNRARDAEQLKAFTRLQIAAMERGIFILEIVVSAAPLIGLLGTVTGLVRVFSRISPDTGLPDPVVFVGGVAMALTTTVVGLAIAIPALAFDRYLTRRIDFYAAQIGVGVERMVATKSHPPAAS
jgi:biopolymer transport protein ExbB